MSVAAKLLLTAALVEAWVRAGPPSRHSRYSESSLRAVPGSGRVAAVAAPTPGGCRGFLPRLWADGPPLCPNIGGGGSETVLPSLTQKGDGALERRSPRGLLALRPLLLLKLQAWFALFEKISAHLGFRV